MPRITRNLLFLLLYGLIGNQVVGQNLVPNPSFEIFDHCPHSLTSINNAPPWRKVDDIGAAVALMHDCGSNGYGLPENWGGYQRARTGSAVANFGLWTAPYEGMIFEGNFIGVPLDSALKEGHKYKVEFYVSLDDSMRYAVRNIGAHFWPMQPSGDIEFLLELEPQVQYSDSTYLDEKVGWAKVGGSFIAEGGESFLTIGNFVGHHDTDTNKLDNGGTPYPNGTYFWDAAYYYLDDVSVIEDTSYNVGMGPFGNTEGPSMNVYPNPNSGTFTMDIKSIHHNATLRIRNTLNQIVYERQIDTGFTTVTQNINFKNGIYLLELDDGTNRKHQNMVVLN